jgi:ubiquinone/menaquinone biosynthesis C-methylase UbiE
MADIENEVKKANRQFYDTVANSYELIDGRRSESLARYVRGILRTVSARTEGDSILDLGCGSAFVSKVAQGLFEKTYAMDISFEIVKRAPVARLQRIVGDLDYIPARGSSFDCVAAFAVLHHCYSFEKLFKEVYRVLRSGGVFYSDHDMNRAFFNRFRLLLNTYRCFSGTGCKYVKHFKGISEETYNYAEYHSEGIPSEMIAELLMELGFSEVIIDFHWYGLSSLADSVLGTKTFSQGLAPLMRVVAVK